MPMKTKPAFLASVFVASSFAFALSGARAGRFSRSTPSFRTTPRCRFSSRVTASLPTTLSGRAPTAMPSPGTLIGPEP